jgi:hypothetical protein
MAILMGVDTVQGARNAGLACKMGLESIVSDAGDANRDAMACPMTGQIRAYRRTYQRARNAGRSGLARFHKLNDFRWPVCRSVMTAPRHGQLHTPLIGTQGAATGLVAGSTNGNSHQIERGVVRRSYSDVGDNRAGRRLDAIHSYAASQGPSIYFR